MNPATSFALFLAIICAFIGLAVIYRIAASPATPIIGTEPDKIEPADGRCSRCGRPLPVDDDMASRIRGDV